MHCNMSNSWDDQTKPWICRQGIGGYPFEGINGIGFQLRFLPSQKKAFLGIKKQKEGEREEKEECTHTYSLMDFK